ncbi:MAG: Hsp70 family protein [Planctomycetota bacterium]|nr:Hsp70 family protein [Planctomycetota bacterium]
MNDPIVGIDLGTTNSEISAYINGEVQLISSGDQKILPSCVGLSPDGDLLVGEAARNQMLIYPERTARSIKRKIGQDVKIKLGDQAFTPQEISAIILKELVSWAEPKLQTKVSRAVITVPAFFSDAQRAATREAGELAGLEVVRILNEPTAASLAYGYAEGRQHTMMVYDLGGGTFDVSIVTVEGDVTEVLASHGNNELGGDDFDKLLADHLLELFRDEHGLDLRDQHPAAYSRIWWATEEAKKKLSFEPYVRIREENLATSADGHPMHLDVELSREQFEDMISPLVESTLESVNKAMEDAGKQTGDLDAILLVGGSTRIPYIAETLEKLAGVPARQDVHPDLCVALGAGVLASRLGGHDIERVLVDVSPFSFGPAYLGYRNGMPYPHCYRPIISRNTPLPVTRAESYYTSYPFQTEVKFDIYQGENPDALKNIHIGSFKVTGLKPMEDYNEVLCRMSLNLDGILNVVAIEKKTGLSKQITISNAVNLLSKDEEASAKERIRQLFGEEESDSDTLGEGPEQRDIEESASPENAAWMVKEDEARLLLQRSRSLLSNMHS